MPFRRGGVAGNAPLLCLPFGDPRISFSPLMERIPATNAARAIAFELLIDSGPFWERLRADIAAAQKRVYVQTLSFEGDRAGMTLATAMKTSPASDKRIIVDYYTKYVLSDKFLLSPTNWIDRAVRAEKRETTRMIADLRAHGVDVRWVNPVGVLLARMACRNHKKIVVVDDRISYIGGINFSDHNFSWHDLMLRIENGDVAGFLGGDFLTSWNGGHFAGRESFGSIELLSLDGRTNESAFAPLFSLMAQARSSIYVQSPYLSRPFTDRLRDAVRRGVRVTVVTPRQNNKQPLKDFILWEAARSGFDVRLYEPGMTHLKAMLIDDSHLVLGSCNFDYFSYRFEQETIAIVTDAKVIAAFTERIITADNNCSTTPTDRPSHLRGLVRQWEMSLLAAVSALFRLRNSKP
jgi:cardiolipin synthase